MSLNPDLDTDRLLALAVSGSTEVAEMLLSRYRARLRQMLAARIDPRLGPRVDASDIIQETLIEAHQRLPAYLVERPLPFYPWLRQIAWNRLVDLHRHHIHVQKRSVKREAGQGIGISDHSADQLAQQLYTAQSSPSQSLRNEEMRRRLQAALDQLPDTMREVLLMRHVERLSVRDIAAIQGVAEGTVKSRHFRALELARQFLLIGERQQP